ncbi:MAG: alpha/beta family hydrolase [Methylocella sp.]|jgi:predicted alpha/beta-hydrolase family hydrolase
MEAGFPHNHEACFRAVIETIRHKQISRCKLAIGGKSMRGRIALQIAAAISANVESLVLLGYGLISHERVCGRSLS